jgi:hypothetical protein
MVGPWSPTQIVSTRDLLSNVTEAQSAFRYVDVLDIFRPSGPGVGFASVWYASTCRLLRSFGAMKG